MFSTPPASGKPQPRYLHLAHALSSEIASGVYPLGSRIPTEFELCEQFGASRHTVRAAIQQLVLNGLVTRRPRVGTIVQRSTPPEPAFRMDVAGVSDLLQYAAITSMRVLVRRLRALTAGEDAALDRHADEHWLYLEGLRKSPGAAAPICFNVLWINPDYRGVKGAEGDVSASVFDLIRQQFNLTIDRIEQEMFAAPLSDRIARALKLPRGSSGLWVVRRYFDHKGGLVEVAFSIHPPETFRFRMTIDRTTST